MYQEYEPSNALLPYIETYWTYDSFMEGMQTVKVLPDGCVDILLNCKEEAAENELPSFCPYIVGTMTTFSDVTYNDGMQMMGIRFRAGGITAFIQLPIHEITNQRIEMGLIETVFEKRRFQDDLAEKKNLYERIRYVDSYLLGKLQHAGLPDRQVMTAVNLVMQNKGRLPIGNLMDKVCLSQRQFERRFKASIGISPKVFSSVIRFRHAHELLQQQSEQSIFLTAIDCGYYDHAHFIREFKRFTGQTPKQQ